MVLIMMMIFVCKGDIMAGITKEQREQRDKLFSDGLKICLRCGEVKKVECFSKHKGRANGLKKLV